MPSRNYFNELIFDYDQNGNEIRWMKVFNGRDTAYVFEKRYEASKLVEEKEFSKKNLEATTKYYYSDGLLTSEEIYGENGKLRRIKRYTYNLDKSLHRIDVDGKATFFVYNN